MSRRWLIPIAALAALAAIAVGIVATIQLLGNRGMLASGLSTLTGREVRFEGRTTLRPGLAPGIRVEGVSVGPAEGSALRSAHIGRLDVVVALWPLLRGRLEAHRLEIDDVVVVLEPSVSGGEAADADVATQAPDAGMSRYSLQEADVRNLKIELRRDGSSIPTTGSIERLTLQRGDGGILEVSAAGAVASIEFDLTGRYDASAPPSGASDRPSLEVEGTVAGARVSGRGSLDLAQGSPSLELRVEADAPHLKAFSRIAQRDLPPVGPVHASGQLELRGETLGVSGLDLRIGSRDTAWLEVIGAARDLFHWRDFSLKSDFGFSDVRLLAPLVRDPPAIGAVAGKASVHDAKGTLGIEAFTLKGGRPGVFEIDAKGSLEDVRRMHGLDAHVDLKAQDLAVIGELFRRTLPPIGPVELSAKVEARRGELKTDHLRARLDRTQLTGSISGAFQPDQRPRITAQLETPELHLADVGIQPEPREAANAPAPAGAAPATQLFDATPLDLGWTQVVDGRLSIRATSVLGVDGPLSRNVEIDARLEDGRVSLSHGSTNFQGGSVNGQLQLDSAASPPTLAVQASAKGMDLGELLAQFDADRAWSGRLDASLDLKSQGASPHALASGLDGQVVASCGSGTISTAHSRLLTRDFLHAIRGVVGGSRKSEVLNCMIVDVAFEAGKGTARTLVIDAKDVLIVGEGTLNLSTETLDLRMIPRPRRASPLSTAVTVRVKGPMAQPSVKVEKGSLVTHTTAALLDNIGSATGVRRAWRMLGAGASDTSSCAKLVGPSP